MEDRDHIFKINYFPIFLCILILAVITFIILVFLDDELNVNLEAVIFALIFCSLGSALLSFILLNYYKITVNSTGVKGTNFWGKSKFVQWSNITSAKKFNLIGLKFVRLFPRDGSLPLWIPLFLNKMSEFKDLTIKLSPEGNVAKNFLSSHNV